ncbi:hypothetical protein TELCIR_17393 [Teladorsagia circumcincta]|uniref:Secreted protein n=1 Tax=Teladorsagia circumcincta TaxID=45464 RepID=A0A2G9TSV8_TELCI|nr:hypothetical protein TELCIR_17393 [Teladorsagia circumcincta]
MLRWVLYSAIVSSCFAVKCYDCYDTGPDHAACTKERSCTGLACMIFDAGDGNNTMTAFCLLAMKEAIYPLLPDAQFLKHNPLLDYQDHNGDSGEGDGAVPMPENVMFPAAMTADPRTAGSADDEDLVPVDFAEYDRVWHERNEKETTTDRPQDRIQDRIQERYSIRVILIGIGNQLYRT